MASLRPALGALALGLAALAGCGGAGDETALAPVSTSDTTYCHAYRSWKVYELDAGGAFDQPSPAALRTWWNAYLVAEETMLREAPSEIRDEVGVKVGHIRTVMTPVLERFAFDLDRLRRRGTPAEQTAFFGLPPAEVESAQGVQYAYEDKTCGTASTPPAAEVAFEAGSASKLYCSALDALNGELEKVVASRFDPGVMRSLVTGDPFADVLDRLDAAAPPEIAADVQADTEWFRTRWSEVVAEYDYDLRRIWVDAEPDDLAVFNRSHPDVLEHTSRTTGYEAQVCDA